ncbi:MAG TPA: transposase, partial [Segetibacter sp.]
MITLITYQNPDPITIYRGSESPWNARTVMDSVAEDTNKLFNDFEEVYFLIDESAHTKKGAKSVGVSRQYSGQLGKVDNCQVAVYGALS